jgi:glycosyltransferase involved in cell wall biosynthesis
MKPEISIIVPVYNVELYLKKCIDSILAQTFTNFEVILVNDGSIDKSGEICNEYARVDQRVKVINQNYGGVSAARNAGLKLASGEYIGFVDGDDRIDKNMYKRMFELCMETESDISICKLGREIDGRLINTGQDDFVKEMDNTEAMRQLFKGVLFRFSLCNKLFKRSCFKGVKFPEGRIHEDLSTTYRLFANASKAVYTDYIGYIYIKRQNSILTSKFNEKRLDAFMGWDEILSFMIERYPQLSQEFISCFVYGCIDNVHSILSQVESIQDRQKYISSIQLRARKYYKHIIKNESLTLKYKYLVTLLSYNLKLFILTDHVKKIIVKAV